MYYEEEVLPSLGAKLAGLTGLWLLTTIWLGLGLLLAATLYTRLGPYGTPAFLLVPLLWGCAMHEGLQIALGVDARRRENQVAAIYIGFASSQLVFFGWLCVQSLGAAMDGLRF